MSVGGPRNARPADLSPNIQAVASETGTPEVLTAHVNHRIRCASESFLGQQVDGTECHKLAIAQAFNVDAIHTGWQRRWAADQAVGAREAID